MTAVVVGEDYFKKLEETLRSAKSSKKLYKVIVNAPFDDRTTVTLLGLGIVVLLLVNRQTGTIDRIALSRTDLARDAMVMSVKPFKSIKIPIGYRGNFIAETIRSGRYQQTSDWQYLFAPDLSPDEARLNQAGAGIACSFIYPLKALDGGALIFSYYVPLNKISLEHKNFMFRYSKLVASSLSSARKPSR